MKTKKLSRIFLTVTAFLIPSLSHATPTLECENVMPYGQYTGHLTNIIDKDGWASTNYIFQTDNNQGNGCVDINAFSNPTRAQIVYNAYLLGADISLSVDSNHNISGIGD